MPTWFCDSKPSGFLDSVNGVEAGYEKAEWELRYAEAFRDYGIDVLALEPAATGGAHQLPHDRCAI